MWTIDKVKAELPDVPVSLPDGTIVTCPVRGRNLKFPVLHLPGGGTVEVAWDTLARVLNKNLHVIL